MKFRNLLRSVKFQSLGAKLKLFVLRTDYAFVWLYTFCFVLFCFMIINNYSFHTGFLLQFLKIYIFLSNYLLETLECGCIKLNILFDDLHIYMYFTFNILNAYNFNLFLLPFIIFILVIFSKLLPFDIILM